MRFTRDGNNLIMEKDLNVWDAILGTSIDITTLDNKTLSINIPAGTQPETMMRITGEGLPHMRTRQRGNLFLKVKVTIPKNLNQSQIEKINQLKYGS